MLRIAKFIMQWGLMPPIMFTFNFNGRRDRPPPPHKPEPARFDPTSKVDNRGARMLAASNALEGKKKL